MGYKIEDTYQYPLNVFWAQLILKIIFDLLFSWETLEIIKIIKLMGKKSWDVFKWSYKIIKLKFYRKDGSSERLYN